MKLKLRKELLDFEAKTYASDSIDLPENGVDCFEGCNPYGFPTELYKAKDAFNIERFAPYPHSNAVLEGLNYFWKGEFELSNYNLMLTDGSVAANYVINNLFTQTNGKVLGVAPQFSNFVSYAVLTGAEYDPIYLTRDKNMRINPEEIIDKLDESYSMVYLDNPNNPTGQIIDIAAIERILRKADDCGVAVVVDEAYGDLMPKANSAIRLIGKYSNLIVMRTLSKGFGLAGLRIGYIIASKYLISCMKKMSNPYQVSEFSREMAGIALHNPHQMELNMLDFAKEKQEIRASIHNNLTMAESYDTVSIFTLFHKNSDVDLKKMFYDHGILCVSGGDFIGTDKSFVRIRLPKNDEFPVLLSAIKDIDEEITA